MYGLIAAIRAAALFLGLVGLAAPAASPPVSTPSAGKTVGIRTAPATTGPRKWAIVIGVGKYTDGRITGLPFCNKDAMDLAGALRARGYEVVCLTDEGEKGIGVEPAARTGQRHAAENTAEATPRGPDAEPTRENITRRVEAFLTDKRIGDGDLVLVYFSGHGFATDDAGYLIPRDADSGPDKEHADIQRLADTCIPAAWLRQQLDACRATQKVLVLDSCHSGVAPKGKGQPLAPSWNLPGKQDAAGRIFAAASPQEGEVLPAPRPEGRVQEGKVTLASCAGTEKSWQKGDNSAYTFYLLKGLGGAADGDRDGQVGVLELSKYLNAQVVAWAKYEGYQQTPVFHAIGVKSDITLADCPKVKSNALLYAGGAAALGGLAVALSSSSSGSSSSSSSSGGYTAGAVEGWVFRTPSKARQLDTAGRLRATRADAPRLCIWPQPSLPPGDWAPAAAAMVSVGEGPGAAADGVGHFSFSLAPGQYKVTATKPGYQSASADVTITANQTSPANSELPARLAFVTQPTSVFAGAAISPGVLVEVRNADGHLLQSAVDRVTMRLARAHRARCFPAQSRPTPWTVLRPSQT